jgi:hypothetical protein
MFVTWFQCVVAVAACYILGSMRDSHPSLQMFPAFEIRMDVAKQVRPSTKHPLAADGHSFQQFVGLYLTKLPLLPLGPAIELGICGHDCFQQPHSQVCWRGLLQRWSLLDNHFQRGTVLMAAIQPSATSF